mmetsp:Transcript_16094/g.61398  ORF Transcript_16094/g.61398 Transcript_16094/m.61398 type:complete len:281 (-) Transcript_16094:386-1228(-)
MGSPSLRTGHYQERPGPPSRSSVGRRPQTDPGWRTALAVHSRHSCLRSETRTTRAAADRRTPRRWLRPPDAARDRTCPRGPAAHAAPQQRLAPRHGGRRMPPCHTAVAGPPCSSRRPSCHHTYPSLRPDRGPWLRLPAGRNPDYTIENSAARRSRSDHTATRQPSSPAVAEKRPARSADAPSAPPAADSRAPASAPRSTGCSPRPPCGGTCSDTAHPGATSPPRAAAHQGTLPRTRLRSRASVGSQPGQACSTCGCLPASRGPAASRQAAAPRCSHPCRS